MRGGARSDDASQPLPDLVRDILVGAGWTRQAPSSGGAARERWESLAALAALADAVVAANPEARLVEFVRELDERASAQHAPTVQGVTLASLHAAKGLEWDTVFLAGCSDGFLPIAWPTPQRPSRRSGADVRRHDEGEGPTRAAAVLAGARTPGARASRRPSRFLDGTTSVLGDGARAPRRSAKGAKVTALRPRCPRSAAAAAPSS